MTILAWKFFSSNQVYMPMVKHHNFLKGSSIIWALELKLVSEAFFRFQWGEFLSWMSKSNQELRQRSILS